MPAKVDHQKNRATLKAMPSHPDRKVVFLREPEESVATIYFYKHGDTTAADDVSVIEPVDGKGRYLRFQP